MVSSIPFLGFGFMDNFIMIIAGDAIDASIGAKLGVSTMAAAGLGNTLSDCVGLFTGDYIEELCRRCGIREPKLTEQQLETRAARFTKTGCSVVGLAFGCLIGMVPLLFKDDRKQLYFSPEQEDLYETLFRPHGVSLNHFFALVRAGKWHTVEEGHLVAARGEPLTEVIMLVAGTATAISAGEDRPLLYLSHHADAGSVDDGDSTIMRGCFLGVAGLLDRSGRTLSLPFPYEVRAASKTLRYVAWETGKLQELMESDKAIESAMLSILYAELLSSTRRNSSGPQQSAPPEVAAASSPPISGKTSSSKDGCSGANRQSQRALAAEAQDMHEMALRGYRLVVETTLADDFVHPAERKFCEDFRKRRGISKEDHASILMDCGWSLEDWERGSKGGAGACGATRGIEDLLQRIPALLQASGIKSRIHHDDAPPGAQ